MVLFGRTRDSGGLAADGKPRQPSCDPRSTDVNKRLSRQPRNSRKASASHYLHSSLREKLIEHVFIGELSRNLWQRGIRDLEILRPETDFAGYDLAIECNGILRHIQLKSSHQAAMTREVAIQTRLADKPSGCAIWIYFDEDLKLGPLLWFGGRPGKPIPSLGSRRARHTRGDRTGKKKERSNLRVIAKRRFALVTSVDDVVPLLFGVA
jgi:hypothetical protein